MCVVYVMFKFSKRFYGCRAYITWRGGEIERGRYTMIRIQTEANRGGGDGCTESLGEGCKWR